MVALDPFELAADEIDPPCWDPPAGHWEPWLLEHCGAYLGESFAPHHERFWDWVWVLEPGHRPDPFVGIWPRGGAKSTSAECACVALAARQARRYGLYICETQEQADDHVSNVASILESNVIERAYPKLAERHVGKYGNSKGWRVNRLRTASGFTIDAVGLDTAARGVKLEDARPDFMVIDDIDSETDSPDVTRRKIKTLTRALLPAGSSDLAVLAIQNLVHPDSLFARMVPGYEGDDGPADFLANRIVVGPVPAVEGLVTEQKPGGGYRIIEGTATWEGQDLDTCQAQIDDWGLTAFLGEAQHDVEPPPGGMYDHIEWIHVPHDEVPWRTFVRTVVWVDPAVTDKKNSDSMGIQCDAIDGNDVIWRLHSWESRTSPLDALMRAIEIAWRFQAEAVGVETDQGGDTWESVYREAHRELEAKYIDAGERLPGPLPLFRSDKAGAGHGSKAHRSAQMLADYERGLIRHVLGTHRVLERSLKRFPLTKPLDLADAAYWSWHDLRFPGIPEGMWEHYDPVSISPV
jgi:hypothetical protein